MIDREVVAARLTAQGLSGSPGRDPVVVAERLLAIQAQDPRGARLAIRARSAGLSVADVDRALTADRSLLITWLNRGTLHLVRSEQLREHLDSAGVRTEGQALVHLLMLACLRGIAIRGPMVGKHHAYALTRDWLEPAKPVAREAMLAEMARRYLVGHGPADDRDLAKWAGLPLRDARAGLAAIGSELVEREDGLVQLAGRPASEDIPPPKLLGPFDPVLHGWVSRDPILGDHIHLVTSNGLFRAFAMVDARAVATWKGSNGKVVIEPLEPIPAKVVAALEEDADDVTRFLGGG